MGVEEDLRAVIVGASSSAGSRVYSRIPESEPVPYILYELTDRREEQIRPEADDVVGNVTSLSTIGAWEQCLVKLTLVADDRAQVNTLREEIKPYLNGFKNSSLMIFYEAYRSEGLDTAVNYETGAVDLTVFYKA